MKLRVVEVGIGEYCGQVGHEELIPTGEVYEQTMSVVYKEVFNWEFIKDPNGDVQIYDSPELCLEDSFKLLRKRIVIEGVDLDSLEEVYEYEVKSVSETG